MHPLERLLNLTALLLETRKPLTFEQIRTSMSEAYGQGDRGAAKRMFERDKDVLRDLGIPIEVVPTDAWEVEDGYRIDRAAYELPEISFTPEEIAALFVAAAAPAEDGEATQAFRKLATGADAGLLTSLTGRAGAAGVDDSAPHLLQVADAASRGRLVRFRYRGAEGEAEEREVDAWGLVFRTGSWYLVGRDRARREVRVFRLSRFESRARDAGPGEPRPEGFRARDHLVAGPWGIGEPDTVATVAFGPTVAWWALGEVPGARTVRTREDGWMEAEVPAAATDAFVSWALSFGPDAEVLAPLELRAAVARALEGVLATV